VKPSSNPKPTKKREREKVGGGGEKETQARLWYLPVIPTTQEIEVGGSQSKISLGKKLETLSEK
jgi:hypothetical protein